MTRVNLLPDSFIARRSRAKRRARAAVATGFAVLVAAGLSAAAAIDFKRLSSDVAAAEAALADARTRQSEADARHRDVATATILLDRGAQLELPVPAAAVVALISQHLPESLVLEKLTIQSPAVDVGPTAAAGAVQAKRQHDDPVRIAIEGIAVSDVDAADLASALSKQPIFGDVKLARSRQLTYGTLSRYGFEISFVVRVPQGAPGDDARGAANGRPHAS